MKRLSIGAVLLVLAGMGWIGYDKYLSYCAQNPSDPACPQVDPTPTPTGTPADPCPVGQCLLGWTNSEPPRPICGECPTPGPPHPTPTPTPEPPATSCPKQLAEGASVSLNNKAYGQGFDTGTLVSGDPEFCRLIHGVAVDKCHLEGWMGPDGNDPTARVRCEMELLGGCPIWQYQVGSTVYPCVDDHDALCSCDHFGNVEYRDDPQTPTTGDTLATLQGFEGQPLECGLQRDIHGPMAGFFTVAHGKAQVRACKPDGSGCGPWRPFDK